MALVELVREAGVVGAGGGGFPTHVKLAGKADTVIANGAECEPLLHKDAAVMEREAARVVAGMLATMEAVGATRGIVGIKKKNSRAIEMITAASAGQPISVHLLGDYYPAGDEYDLVYETTGRLIPPAGIPLNVGAVVCNVETFANISRAAENLPVTEKTVTIGGAVRSPVTLTVPVGTPFREVIDAAGGLTTDDPVLCLGGLMMGTTSGNLDTPVLKTTTGAIVLPRTHHVVRRKLKPWNHQAKIGKSACDQCRFCTDLCPRYLLGYPVEPHRVMRSLGFTATDRRLLDEWAALCCSCGLCTLYSCPEELFPKEACDTSKDELRKAGFKWTTQSQVHTHPLREGRRVPIRALMRKLDVEKFDHPAHWEDLSVNPARVVLPLKQAAGAPASAVVKSGDQVKKGQVIGRVPDGTLGAHLHASIEGIVTVNETSIAIQRTK